MIAQAIATLRPGAQWVLNGDTLSGLVWLDQSQTPPTQAEIDLFLSQVPRASIDAERDRRLRTVPFAGKLFGFCDAAASDKNITGAGTLALAAIIAGAQVGDLRWADPTTDFRWVAEDNSSLPMDAHTCLSFAQTAALWKTKHIYAARALKDMSPIPADYASDSRWPSP